MECGGVCVCVCCSVGYMWSLSMGSVCVCSVKGVLGICGVWSTHRGHVWRECVYVM